jgi:hypothetical protein
LIAKQDLLPGSTGFGLNNTLAFKVVFERRLRFEIDRHFCQEHLDSSNKFDLFEQCFDASEMFYATLLGFKSSV